MYILIIASAIKETSVNEIRYFFFQNYYKLSGFVKERSFYSMKRFLKKDFLLLVTKLIEKIHDSRNVKEQYQSFVGKPPTKSVKQSEIITSQLKTFENPNIVDIKSVITKHPKSFT